MESDFKGLLPVLLAISFGAILLLVIYWLFSSRRKTEVQQKSKHKSLYSKDDKSAAHTEKKKESAQSAKTKKKLMTRSEKQVYAHPWLLTTLKGHTGSILDIDFSSNGKYLVSCGDEDPDPGGVTTESSSSSESTKENSLPRSEEPSPNTKGLSRRQRKNRKREDLLLVENLKQKKQRQKKTSESSLALTKKQVMSVVPLKQFIKFNKNEKVFSGLLHNYLLTYEQMVNMGYPVKYSDQNIVFIYYKCPRDYTTPLNKGTTFDVNASAFIPQFGINSEQIDSGQGSGSSSDSGENFDAESISSSSSDQDSHSYYEENQSLQPPLTRDCYVRTCVRCSRIFYTTSNDYITKEKCTYHWGRLHTIYDSIDKNHSQLVYSCCEGRSGSRGCSECPVHVWNGIHNGVNSFYEDYVCTKPRRTPPSDGNYGVYALDCEMCHTVRGLEVIKVTVVGSDGRLVYDSFIKPDFEIVDYNTRFSGITQKDLKRNATKNLREVQNDLMGFINANTILIGHGLENDLRALKIVHYYIVDTSYSFPHYRGLPYRHSLKNLALSILKREIQAGQNGHNSYEDASACMELMIWRVRKDFRSYLLNLK